VCAVLLALSTDPGVSQTSIFKKGISSVVLPAIVVNHDPEAVLQPSSIVLRPDVRELIAALILEMDTMRQRCMLAKDPLRCWVKEVQSLSTSCDMEQRWMRVLGPLCVATALRVQYIPGEQTTAVQLARVFMQELCYIMEKRTLREMMAGGQQPGSGTPPLHWYSKSEREKLYWIQGYIISKLQLGELKRKNAGNVSLPYLQALNSLRVPRGSSNVPHDAIGYQKVRTVEGAPALISPGFVSGRTSQGVLGVRRLPRRLPHWYPYVHSCDTHKA
jgi:hypothetical protein